MYLQQIQHNLTSKELGHLHILYAGQRKFGGASRIYITLVWWASRLEMLISTPVVYNVTHLKCYLNEYSFSTTWSLCPYKIIYQKPERKTHSESRDIDENEFVE